MNVGGPSIARGLIADEGFGYVHISDDNQKGKTESSEGTLL